MVMKKRFFLCLNIAAAAVALLASCGKDEADVVSIGATINDYNNSEKVYVDNNRYTWWNNGDGVYINGVDYSLTVAGDIATIDNVAANQDGYYAVYPASLCGTASSGYPSVTLPQRQVYRTDGTNQILDAPMADYSGNADPALNFTNLCSLLKVTLPDNRLVAAIVVSNTGANLWGTCTLSGQDNPVLSAPSNGGKTVWLDCGTEGVSSANNRPFYVVLPSTNLTNLQVKVIVYKTVSGVKYTEIYNKESTAAPHLLANMVYTFDVPQNATYTEPWFTVANNRHARFAPGNLQYQASTNTWRFAPNEWDALVSGGGNTNPSASQSAWIDLFGYGTSGESYVIDRFLLPDINVPNDPWTHDGGVAFIDGGAHYYNHNIAGTNYDWGWRNPISNGGNAPQLWRTPKRDEWYYLLADLSTGAHLTSYRSMAGGLPYARKATLAIEGGSSVTGLIIYPDNVSKAVGDNGGAFSSGTSTLSLTWGEWRYLDLMGCVFLPYGGIRNGTTISETSTGQYWSGSVSGEIDNSDQASHIIFPSSDPLHPNGILDPRQGSYLYWGLSVREIQYM